MGVAATSNMRLSNDRGYLELLDLVTLAEKLP